MSSFLFLLFAFGILAHEGHDHHHHHDHDHHDGDGHEHVLTLNAKNFDETVAAHPLLLIEFYAPWCGHCKKLAPEYEKAASILFNEIALAKVDCTTEKDLCSKYGVQGFPTLKIFRNDGKQPTDYPGGREADDIVKILRKQNQPAFQLVENLNELAKLKEGDSELLGVGFFRSADSAEAGAFKNVANQQRNELEFALITKEDIASAEGVSFPGFVLFRKSAEFDVPKVTFSGEFTEEALGTFIKRESFPLLGEIGPENYQKYVERGLPLLWAFLDYSNAASVESVLIEVARNHPQVSFVKLDGSRWGAHAKNFGLGESLPGIVIEDREKRKNYVFPQTDSVTADALATYVKGFVDGTLAPTVKSQEPPTTNDEPVKVIVGKTFEQIVYDKTKDVLVEFYAPWCGHCKNLAPKYEELGKEFQSVDSVIIAKVDSTENDTPADIKGFPTLIFYPANNKENPITYKGERSKQALADFIRENAHTLKQSKSHEDL